LKSPDVMIDDRGWAQAQTRPSWRPDEEGRTRRESRPFVYRAALSAADVCAIIDALDEITSDKGREYETEDAPRLRALRERLAELPGVKIP